MTTFTTISNALVAVGARPFATTIQALRDNPLAIQEGDPTAPKIADAALSTSVTSAGINWVAARLSTSAINSFIAGSSVGAVGTYAFLGALTSVGVGATFSGASLTYNSTTGGGTIVGVGTWRCMGQISSGSGGATVFLRIS